MKDLDFWINFIANLSTILVSCVGLYVYYMNRDKIKSAINFVLNYSNQITLTDLKFKIERLNDFNASEPSQKNEVINILHEIEGQINGNELLQIKLQSQLAKITSLISNPKNLSEPKKRSLVSELRESIRNVDNLNFKELIGNQNSN